MVQDLSGRNVVSHEPFFHPVPFLPTRLSQECFVKTCVKLGEDFKVI